MPGEPARGRSSHAVRVVPFAGCSNVAEDLVDVGRGLGDGGPWSMAGSVGAHSKHRAMYWSIKLDRSRRIPRTSVAEVHCWVSCFGSMGEIIVIVTNALWHCPRALTAAQ
eukprot:4853894-Pyramimonas_sp.AAC.1